MQHESVVGGRRQIDGCEDLDDFGTQAGEVVDDVVAPVSGILLGEVLKVVIDQFPSRQDARDEPAADQGLRA